jgi:hypothetical protein
MDEDGAEGDALRQAAWEVYGVPPTDFVATRTRWVKELRSSKQREAANSVGALRKPSVSAAAINALVRRHDPVVDRLRDIGTRMRHAQSALDAAGLAAMRDERDELLRDWVAAAGTHSPGTLTAAAEAEVRDTAVAALADGAAAEVMLSGTLTRSLSYSGFGEVDISDAVARTSTGVVLTRIEGGGETEAPEKSEEIPEEEDQEIPEEADEDELDDAEDDEETPEQEDEAHDPADEDALAQLEEALAHADEQVTAARRARRSLLEAADVAAARAEEAQEVLTEAQQRLARATKEAESATAAAELARTALEDAEETLAAARELRDRARTALEEAEDTD